MMRRCLARPCANWRDVAWTMTQLAHAAHRQAFRSVGALLASVALLLALMTCSVTEETSEESHVEEHETDPPHHDDDAICCASLVCILLPESGSDVLGAQARLHMVRRGPFLLACSSESSPELRTHRRSSWDRGLPFYLQAQSSSTPCGPRAPPGHFLV